MREQTARYAASPSLAIAHPVRAGINVRVPDVAVTCTRLAPGQQVWPDPLLLIEILSPGNAADTWENVWSYCTIPSVREIAIVHSTRALRSFCGGGGRHWPEETEKIEPGGTLSFECIGFSCPLSEVYAETPLGDDEPT